MFKTKKPGPAPTTPELRPLNSAEISRIAGVSLRQLQWWDEQKVVSPKHEGHKRLYSVEEGIEVSVIAELRRKGFSLQKIRRVLRFLQREMGRRLAEILNSDNEFHLLTDGRSIYLEDSPQRIIDLLKSARQPMFLVSVSDQARRISIAPRKPMQRETATAVKKSKAV
jgi:DNA-binding transcriptional MerR regulator